MIPLQLTIEGLYSYQERQTIDFTQLTEAGLFGIFGSVGSGKSSILEAISYALYGETERLNARDKRTYNMMNLKSNRSYIEFDFKNYEDELYRATREFKRNSKNFDEVRPPSVTFYHWKNEQWIPLQNADAEKIIGLSYTNFKRTIIIPQGQFKEFLELGEAERTKMMKEIFGLQRFDLQENASKLNKANQTELDQLEGQLKGFDAVSVEEIENIQEQLVQAKENYQIIADQSNKENELFQQLKKNKEDVELLQTKKQQIVSFQEEKTQLEDRKKVVDEFESLSRVFDGLLKEKYRIEQAIAINTSETQTQQKELLAIEETLAEVEQQIIFWKQQFDVLPIKRQEENEWVLIQQNIKATLEIQTLEERLQKGEVAVRDVQAKLQTLEQQIKEGDQLLQQLSQQRTDTQLLLQIDQWFSQKEHLLQQVGKQEKEVVAQKDQLDHLMEMARVQQLDLQQFEGQFAQFKHQYDVQKQALEAQKNHLMVQKQMAVYVHELHDGSACPLCGALDHPNVVEASDVSSNLEVVAKQTQDLETTLEQWQKKASEVQRIIDREKIFSKQLADETAKWQEIQQQLMQHDQLFVWSNFDKNNPEAFQAIKKATLEGEKRMQETSELLTKHREDWTTERANLDKFQKALEVFKHREIQFISQINHNCSMLRYLKWDELKQLSEEEASSRLEELKEMNASTETNYQKQTEVRNEWIQKKTALAATIEMLQKQAIQLQNELQVQEQSIQVALQDHQKAELSEVLSILDQEIDVAKERQAWEEFVVKYETLQQQIKELEDKVAQLDWSEEKFTLQEQLVAELLEKVKLATEQQATLEAEKLRLEKAFEEKRSLLEKQSALQSRAENLKTMLNLFKGAGFVQYVSSIYLRQLCDHANERFHRMTRNQLSLQLNDKGDFEIIDYLNEGKSRSVKTLSGGQAFQASLSLALALAESVQTNAKADKNFFFIDEGFGTQDAESVNVVFETLTSLQKENRIVGIISHVEELKERIPVSLSIRKDEEKGSLISVIG